MQHLLASGSGTTGPPANRLNNIDNPSAHKRALEANEAAIEHHERSLKRARRDRRALQAMEFDEEEEKEDGSEEDPSSPVLCPRPNVTPKNPRSPNETQYDPCPTQYSPMYNVSTGRKRTCTQ
ncbi:hypothetical protein CF326_g4463 [Tilletia indica]|nr:hypothetical protein CF326_g4463 [Tilletia indica]